MSCEGRRVFLENYRIVVRNPQLGRKLKVVFSSFLFDGIWGISNIKLSTGCVGFATLN